MQHHTADTCTFVLMLMLSLNYMHLLACVVVCVLCGVPLGTARVHCQLPRPISSGMHVRKGLMCQMRSESEHIELGVHNL